MFRLLLTIFSLVAAQGLPVSQEKGLSYLSGRIVNGSNTTIEDYPYQVGLIFNLLEYGSGAIISPNWVITAAHLVENKVVTVTRIRAGSTYRLQGSYHEVDRIIIHENYTYGGHIYLRENNIALIRVKNPFKFDKTRQPIKLSETRIPENQHAYVAGWGQIKEGSYIPSDVLVAASTTIDTMDSCNKTYKDIGFIYGVPNGYVCGYGTGPSYGDEGAPLRYKGHLVGIVSRFHEENSEVLYSDISYYRHWIIKNSEI